MKTHNVRSRSFSICERCKRDEWQEAENSAKAEELSMTGCFGPKAILLPCAADFPCQRHVNQRTSLFNGLFRWMQANVSQLQGWKLVNSKACRLSAWKD